MSFDGLFPVPSALDRRSDKWVRLKPDTTQIGWFWTTDIGSLTIGFSSSDLTSSVFCLRILPTRTKSTCPRTYVYTYIFLDYPCIRPLRGSVKYKCIMDVFTLSPWTAQVWAIYVNSIKAVALSDSLYKVTL